MDLEFSIVLFENEGYATARGDKGVQDILASTADAGYIKDGTYPIGFVNEDLGLKWLEAGLPIELIYPEDGVINTVDCLSIIKGAKNMDNAKLFIDFFGSPENHAVLVDPILRRSTRTDAPLAEGLTPTTEYNLVDADKISRDDITAQYNTAYEQSRAN